MKVLNFGSLNYDYVYQVEHIMRPGETQASQDLKLFCGGKGLNQSIALSKAGVAVYHAGTIGEEGDELLGVCRKYGVNTEFIRRIPGRSGHTIIQVDRNAQNCILLYGGANRAQSRDYMDEVLDHFSAGDLLLLQNEINDLDYLIEQAWRKKMKIILNPSPFDENLDLCDLSKIDIFMMNETEGAQIAGVQETEKILETMKKRYPDAEVVLTLGEQGAIYQTGNRLIRQAAVPVSAVDTTAAGDTFTGYFAAGLVEGRDAQEIMQICAVASAITVTRAGAAESIPEAEEVNEFITVRQLLAKDLK
jgi:ribokinase